MVLSRIRTLHISSFSEYVSFVEEDCLNDFFIFRGQKKDTDLLPKIARSGLDQKDLPGYEKKMFSDFKRFSLPYITGIHPQNDWEWLTLAEHHGLPTRLLDWTKNPLAALWFTVRKGEEEREGPEGVVWVLRTIDSDHLEIKTEKDPFALKALKVYEPSHITRRITAQAACFTVHNSQPGSGFVPLNRNAHFRNKLTKLKIPASEFEKLRNQLDRCGINGATLFSDLDDLCKYIAWKNTEPNALSFRPE